MTLKPSAFGALGAALLLCVVGCQKSSDAGDKPKPKPPEVGVISVTAQDAPFELELPGRLSASQVAEIRPQVSGIVQRRLFEEGALVRAGQPLYQIDPAGFQAEHARAVAALQKAEAQAANARARAQRDAELLQSGIVTRQAGDDSAAALRQAEADVAVAQAALATARIQLARTRIEAPIGGRVDLSAVTPGALVTANQIQALTTVQRLDPMQVDIVQSSAELLALRRQLEGRADGGSVQLMLEDGTPYPLPGRLQVSGVGVDRGTGAVTLRASVPNPQGQLLPGMVVSARLLAGVDRQVILVPQQGVSRLPTGEASAMVVGEGNKAERRALKLERAVGNQWLVSAGLKVGDKLIVEGLQRVRPNQPVTPVAASMGSAKKAANQPAQKPAGAKGS